MNNFRTIKIKKKVCEDNNKKAEEIKTKLKDEGVLLLNLMSSPGSGKTTTLLRTIEKLNSEFEIGIIESDVDADVDAKTISKTNVKTVQLNTGGMCHTTASMTQEGLDELGINNLDLIVLENIGNLICPAGFDTGASKSAMILSVPEGDDKPLKYPEIFKVVDIVIVNKMDTLSVFDFNLDKFKDNVKKINSKIEIIPISAKTGEGVDNWTKWLKKQILEAK